MQQAETAVLISRGEITESSHRAHIAVVDSHGNIIASLGNPNAVTFARSTAKLMQAIPVIESGAADDYGLTDSEIALLCASHNGEHAHVDKAQSILHKAHKTPEHLQCGAHSPYYAPAAKALREAGIAPVALHNNCSGKHSGMLALCTKLNVSSDNYLSIEHPVQQLMLKTVSEMVGVPAEDIPLGIDGCGVPVFGMPISALALGYCRLGHPDELAEPRKQACKRILKSVKENPFFLAGSERFDTRLIEVTGGRIIGKMGAEGVFALTVPDQGLGVVIKIEDGSLRALYVAVMEALIQLQLLSEKELEELASFHETIVRNWQGTEVGRAYAQFKLNKSPKSEASLRS